MENIPESKIIIWRKKFAYWVCPRCGKENIDPYPNEILIDNIVSCGNCPFQTTMIEMRDE